jgi:hypothetical protein
MLAACLAANATSFDAAAEPVCGEARAGLPVVVPAPQLAAVLHDAYDSTGAFDLHNPSWSSISEAQGVPVPSTPPHSAPDDHGIMG